MSRTFYAYFLKDNEETALGIVEKDGTETIAFQSIYIDENLSNRESIVSILNIIYNSLGTNEISEVGLNNFKRNRSYHIPFSNKIEVFYAGYEKNIMREVYELASDAIERKTTIKETL